MEAFSHPTRDKYQTVLIQRFVKEQKKILIQIQKSRLLQTRSKRTLITLSPINSAQTTIAQYCIGVPLPAVINLLKLIETLLLSKPSTGHHLWQVTRLKANLTSLLIRMQKSSKKLMIRQTMKVKIRLSRNRITVRIPLQNLQAKLKTRVMSLPCKVGMIWKAKKIQTNTRIPTILLNKRLSVRCFKTSLTTTLKMTKMGARRNQFTSTQERSLRSTTNTMKILTTNAPIVITDQLRSLKVITWMTMT